MAIKSHLETLLREIMLNEPNFALLFADGLNREQIMEKAKEVEINFPDELIEIYQWKNGISRDALESKSISELAFIYFAVFQPLDEAIEEFKICAGNASYPFWPKDFYPIFFNGFGDYYFLDCNTKSPTYKMILCYSITLVDFESDTVTMFDSIESFIKTIIDLYKEKIKFKQSDDIYTLPDLATLKQINLIGYRNNPRSNYWRQRLK